jgi:hypothetical protein
MFWHISDYQAWCSSHPSGGWWGSCHSSRSEAQADADEHNKNVHNGESKAGVWTLGCQPASILPTLVSIGFTINGNIVAWMKELYKEISSHPKAYSENPFKFILEFSMNYGTVVASAVGSNKPKPDPTIPVIEGTFDAVHLLEVAERITNDEEYAKRFQEDPSDFISQSATGSAECTTTSDGKVTCTVRVTWEW